MKMKGMNAMEQFLVHLMIFLSASYVNAFLSLNHVAGDQIWLNHMIWFKETNKQNCEANFDSIINLDGQTTNQRLEWNAELLNVLSTKHTPELPSSQPVQYDEEIIRRSPNATNAASSQQALLSIQYVSANNTQQFSSACFPFSTIHSNLSSELSCWVHSLAVKVQASSTLTASRHAFALLAFDPVTSTNQNSFATIALKAIVEMQASADSPKTCTVFRTLAHEHQHLNRTHPIFQLIDVFIPNKTKMCNASQLAANEHKGLIKSKCCSPFSWLLNPSKCIRGNRSNFWTILCHQKPFQIMGPTNTN